MSKPLDDETPESVAGSDRSVLDDVVRALHANPDDTYWARRLFDLVRDPATAVTMHDHLVLAMQRFAARDRAFFIHERYLSEQLAIWAWPRGVLDDLEEFLDLGDASMTHFVLGRLWLEARRPPESTREFSARAAHHLREVSPKHRVGAWHEAICEALSVLDPHELGNRASAILSTVAEQNRERVILAILRGAARISDWELFDRHRKAYSGMVPCSEIARLDQLRAEETLDLPRRHESMTIPAPGGISETRTARPPSRPDPRAD